MSIPIILEKSKKGFSLIEVVVSISIFMILSFSIYDIKLSYIKSRELSNNKKIAVDTIKTLEHICKYDNTYSNLYNMKDKTMYLNNNKLNSYKLFNEGLDILDEESDGKLPYMKIQITEKDYLQVRCTFCCNKNENIYYDFIRGKFDEK